MPEIPSTFPTTDVSWAEGGSAVVSEPVSFRTNGWQANQIHPRSSENWINREHGRHLDALEAVAIRKFNYVWEGVRDCNPGDTFALRPDNLDYTLGDSAQFTITGASDIRHIAHDGRWLYAADFDGRVWAVDPVNSAVRWTFTPSGIYTESGRYFDTDGAIVALISAPGSTEDLYILNAETGAAHLEYSSLTTYARCVHCASTDGEKTCWFSNSNDLYRWTESGGVLEIISNVGYIRGICTTPRYVHIVYGSSTTASAHSVRTYLRNSPYTLQGTTSLGVSADHADICSDGEALYVSYHLTGNNVGVQKLPVQHWKTGLASPYLWSGSVSLGSTTAFEYHVCRVDDRYFYYSIGNSDIIILDKITGALVDQITGLGFLGLDVDGQFVWTARGTDAIYRYNTQRGDSLWAVAGDVTDASNISTGIRRKPFYKLALPITRT